MEIDYDNDGDRFSRIFSEFLKNATLEQRGGLMIVTPPIHRYGRTIYEQEFGGITKTNDLPPLIIARPDSIKTIVSVKAARDQGWDVDIPKLTGQEDPLFVLDSMTAITGGDIIVPGSTAVFRPPKAKKSSSLSKRKPGQNYLDLRKGKY